MANIEHSICRVNRFQRQRLRFILPAKPDADLEMAWKLQQEEYEKPASPAKRPRDSCYEEPGGSPPKSARLEDNRQTHDASSDLDMNFLDLGEDADADDVDLALKRC